MIISTAFHLAGVCAYTNVTACVRWAVGVLAWEMLTSKNPFEGKTKEVTLKKIVTGKLALPSYLDAHTHSLLKGVRAGALLSIVFER